MAITKKTNTPAGIDGNIDLGFSLKKKKFTVGSDPNKIIEFDPTDLGVANRLSKALPDFAKLEEKWNELNQTVEKYKNSETDDETLESAKDFSEKFDELESNARRLIDEVFDSEVAAKLLGNSSAFSPVNGFMKYEHIITAMLKCYEQQIQDEAPKFNARNVQKYTNKYIKK